MARCGLKRLNFGRSSIVASIFLLHSTHASTAMKSRTAETLSTTGVALSSVSETKATTPESTPEVHLVKVGSGGFQFEPAQLNNISVGDVVMFEFYPPDHSVARAEFGSACMPYEYTGRDKPGFWSGTQWVRTMGDVRFD